jgi:hypothetical protein
VGVPAGFADAGFLSAYTGQQSLKRAIMFGAVAIENPPQLYAAIIFHEIRRFAPQSSLVISPINS